MKSPNEMFAIVMAALSGLMPKSNLPGRLVHTGTKQGTRKSHWLRGVFGRRQKHLQYSRCTCPGCLKASSRGGNSNPSYNGF